MLTRHFYRQSPYMDYPRLPPFYKKISSLLSMIIKKSLPPISIRVGPHYDYTGEFVHIAEI